MKKIIMCIFTFALIGSLYYISPYREEMNKPIVNIAFADTENIRNLVTVRGSIEEGDYNYIKSTKTGVVLDVYVNVGDYVKKGQTLAKIGVSEDATFVMPTDTNAVEAMMSDYTTASFSNAVNEMIDIGEIDENHYYTITSTQEGTIMFIPNIGDNVISGSNLFKVSDLTDLIFRADVPEIYSADIKKGMTTQIYWTGDDETIYTGSIESINPYAETSMSFTETTGAVNVEIYASINENTVALKPGYTATAKIHTDYKEDALIIPYSAIFQKDSTQYVYVYENGIINERKISTGYEIAEGVEVIEGISYGEYIVTNVEEYYEDGLKVRIEG